MEYEIEKTTCKKCTGEVKCVKMCEVHTCKALVNYIKNIDVVETRIGEFDSTVKGGKQDLVVSGHQVYGNLLESGAIMTDIGTVLDATRKFKNAYNKTPVQILNIGREQLGITIEEAQNITNIISKLNSNKLVILPFKPETMCVVETPESFRSEQDMVIKTVSWRTNKETHKLEASIKFASKSGGGPAKTYLISEYLTKFKVQALSLMTAGEQKDISLISINNYGMIKPVEVVHNGITIAVDGTYVYSTIDNVTQIIGAWDTKGDLVIVSRIKSKALTKIEENAGFLKKHRKYIAPYKLHDANTIEL